MTRTDIATLPVAERLQLMEALWESLDEDSSAAVPDWHAEVLAERASQYEQGQEETTDWEEAKRRIRNTSASKQ